MQINHKRRLSTDVYYLSGSRRSMVESMLILHLLEYCEDDDDYWCFTATFVHMID